MQHSGKRNSLWYRTSVLFIALLSAVTAFADTSKISPDLLPLTSGSHGNVNVIIQYNTPPTASSSGGLLGGVVGVVGGVVGGVVNLLGGVVNTVFSLIPALSATVNSGNLLAISNQSNVAYISLDRSVAGMDDYTNAAVNAPYAWSLGLDGSGVGIAIIDSGIYAHPDLKRLRRGDLSAELRRRQQE